MARFSPTAIKQRYAGDNERPLGGYLVLMTGYGGLVAGLSSATRLRRVELPAVVRWSDVIMLAAATHKISRLIAKDPVTSPLRAPFTRFVGQGGEAELSEEVIGTGPPHAIGELVTCPFCLAQWVATVLVFGSVLAPRATRLVTTTFTAVTAADAWQLVYDAAQQAVSS